MRDRHSPVRLEDANSADLSPSLGDVLSRFASDLLKARPPPAAAWWPSWIDAAAIVGAIGAALQTYQWAVGRPLWLDEEMIAINVRDRGLSGMAGSLWLSQSAPMGWLVMQHLIVLVLGGSEQALRLLPLLFNLATIATAVWIGRRWMSPLGAAALTLTCSFGQWVSFYSLELKHYSADIFFGLLLPALAVWAVERPSGTRHDQVRSVALWWAAAAIAQWFSNGAILVTPSCVLVMLLVFWRRGDIAVAVRTTALGLIWLAAFGLHYSFSIRATLQSESLNEYWQFALPPAGSGVSGRVGWLVAQLQPFAEKPGGTHLPLLFWAAIVGGFALMMVRRPPLGLTYTAVALAGFAMAGLRVVPFYERLSLWMVPALYVGIAFAVDASARLGIRAVSERRWMAATACSALCIISYQVSSDIFYRGRDHVRDGGPRDSNHQLDDRTAVRWLLAQRQSGDVLLATRLSLPAVWWYGGLDVSEAGHNGGRQRDGAPIFEVKHASTASGCRMDALRTALEGQRRALVYLGFRFDDVPKGFDALLLHQLTELGTIQSNQEFGGLSRAIVVDFQAGPQADHHLPTGSDSASPAMMAEGCVTVKQAVRW
jgi:hypothetical protein